jgi:hypothetical protein
MTRTPQAGEAEAGTNSYFLLSIKPKIWEQFKESVVVTAHETGFLKKKPNECSEG